MIIREVGIIFPLKINLDNLQSEKIMTTIREKLNEWRDEDVDMDKYITNEEIDKLEKIIKEII